MAAHRGRARSLLARLYMTCCLLLLLAIAGAGLVLLIHGARHADHIYPGVSVLGVPIGGMTTRQANEHLTERIAEDGGPLIHLREGNQEWLVASQDIGGTFDLDDAVAQAYALGRQGPFTEDWLTRARLYWRGYDIVPTYKLEPGPALVFLRHVARAVASPAQSATLEVTGLETQRSTASSGRELDIQATHRNIERAVRAILPTPSWGLDSRVWPPSARVEAAPRWLGTVETPLAFRDVVPSGLGTEIAANRTSALLSAPLRLRCTWADHPADWDVAPSPREWAVDQATLATWLQLSSESQETGIRVRAELDPTRIASLVSQIAADIAQTPREGRFRFDPADGTLTTLEAPYYGIALDQEAANEAIAQACFANDHSVDLPVRWIAPRVTRAALEALLPLSLISEGESSFRDSSAGRLQNIQTATARFDGLTLPAQSAFSFLQALGQVTVANGYSQSWVILGDETVLGPGGGVCQVSTTCFRAAFLGGYPILERWPHSYRVSWYEPPLGLDAAVFEPITDMRFLNDTDSPILVQTEVNLDAATLHFRFYGAEPRRQVTLEGPETSNPTPAGEPIIEQNPALAPGQRLLIERAHDGIDASIYRIIEEDGQIVSREELRSHYRAWPARYQVGPEPPPTPHPQGAPR